MSFLTHLLGSTLLSRKGEVDTQAALGKKDAIGLYFTASWCNPCREFTPILATVYRNMSLSMYKDLQMQERMEVVMVSMDRDAGDFQDYLLQTPFLALPHHRRDIAKDLWKRYEVKKIPTLVFIDHHGQVIEREGRRMIENNFMDLRAVWKHLLGDNVFANDAWHPAQPQ